MNDTINYIENNLDNTISYEKIAKISFSSMHQFGRIFSYVVGISLSEYIRRRRLTLAGFDLQSSNEKVIDIAVKYGYESPHSFTRAFVEMHGVTPKQARSKGVILKSFPKLSFHISINGGTEMNYRIEEKSEIKVVGLRRKIINGDDSVIWNEFFSTGVNTRIWDEFKLYRPPFWQIGIYIFDRTNNESELFIGAEIAETNDKAYNSLDTLVIPAKTWAVFTVNGTGGKAFGEAWMRINTEWLPTSGYKHINDYELEIFPMDKSSDDPDYKSEIWIPVVKH